MDLLGSRAKRKTNEKSSRHPWENARLVILKKLIKKDVSLPEKSIVFDIGCGDAFVVENLAKEYP